MRRPVAEVRPPRGLIDTSVVIDLPAIDLDRLPLEVAISAITLAELAAGSPVTAPRPLGAPFCASATPVNSVTMIAPVLISSAFSLFAG